MPHNTGTISALAGLAIACSTIGGCTVATDASSENVAQASQELLTLNCPADVPAAIVPAADQSIKTIRGAVGVQSYMRNATSSGYAWTFVAPQANLLTQKGKLVGTHFIGPTW